MEVESTLLRLVTQPQEVINKPHVLSHKWYLSNNTCMYVGKCAYEHGIT